MEDKNVKGKKKEKRFFKKITGFKRFSLFFGIWFVIIVIVFAASAEFTSRPNFCPTCHYMEPFYNSWKTSSHNKIQCVECHFEPGLQGTIKGKLNGLVQIVSYVSRSYKRRKPWADIPDNTCSRSGCHETQNFNDTLYFTKGIQFNHKHHLGELRRGKKLKCTSCHSQIVQGSHMEVTYATCFNCHFRKSPDPEHNSIKLTDCYTCHNLKDKPKEELAAMRYNHVQVVENNIQCSSCHNNVLSGSGEVGKERCFQCHFEDNKLDKYSETEFMHSTHIAKHSMNCLYCHSQIQHKIQKIDPDTPPDCQSCHTNAHTSQVSLYAGINGFNVENNPSSMYLSGINCKGCHTLHEKSSRDISTSKAEKDACDKCHGKGYGNLIKQWETASIKRLGTIKSIYNTANSIVKSSQNRNINDAVTKLEQAMHNIKIVEIGKSVHNIMFADKLLLGSYGLMNEALKAINSSKRLPEFKSNEEYIPNECYNCHAGIQEINKKIFNKNFSHNLHIAKNRIQCNKCHSNDKKHGELIISEKTCNSCHHTDAKTNESCGKCHSFQTQVYNGNIEGKNKPDIMKSGGVGCVDCHTDKGIVYKPDSKICSKCHDKEYENMMSEWREDIKKLSGTLQETLSKINNESLDAENVEKVNRTKLFLKKINSYPSIYIHNYDLISTLLSDYKKGLKDISK